MKTNIILNGDAMTHLKELPEKSINCVMTSPPYWALRDYGVENQLGLEPTFEEYIKKLCDIFDEVKRVLRDDGVCFVNIGDTYSATRWSGKGEGQPMNKMRDGHRDINPKKITNLPDKTLVMIPERFALEMIKRGWLLRNVIIWHKKNCMPESAKDRFTRDFEYLYFFSKSQKYFFEQQFEKHLSREKRPDGIIRERTFGYDSQYPEVRGFKKKENVEQPQSPQRHGNDINYGLQGRNKRTVWAVNPKPFPDSHFAVYPEELCKTPIQAGCPERICVKCGKPWILDVEYSGGTTGKGWHDHKDDLKQGQVGRGGIPFGSEPYQRTVKGLKPDCKCNADFRPGIVLDPFGGAGTTGIVAIKQKKEFILIEINPEYVEIASKRLKPHLEQKRLP